MSRTDLMARAEALRHARTPYVLATVVRAQRPTSAKAGDIALLMADGTLDGFVGGTCAQSTVRTVGLRLLETGASTLLRITPDAGPAPASGGEPGILAEDPGRRGYSPAPDEHLREEQKSSQAEGLMVVNNPCLSGGALEIFMEAILPAPLVQVYGDAPVAQALMRVGAAIGYHMAAADATAGIPPDTAAVVVASHGRDEEAVISAAQRAGVPYLALVASRKRGDAVLASLGTDRERVHTPAGLDIGARSAPEIAVSIFAEIIASRPRTVSPPAAAQPEPDHVLPAQTPEISPELASAIDPVCGMTVAITPTALQAEHAGQTYYFCGSACKVAFIADPRHYGSVSHA